MKYVFAFLALLFAVFAIVQWNDPDSLPWILMYAVVTGFFGLAATDRFFQLPVLVIGSVCFCIALFHFPGLMDFITNDDGIKFSQGMSNEFAYIEKAREFGGALIASLALGWLYLQGRKQK